MAEDEIKVKKDRDPILMVCFVVFLLTSCAIIGATVYNDLLKADNTMAVTGSSVEVNYTGTYYAYYEDDNYVVFDTSFWSIADNDDILKSNDFTARSQNSYSPLKFTVGGTDVLTGFGNAVIGHKVGDKVRVMIPAGEGYNAANTEERIASSHVFAIPSSENLTTAQFKEIYGYELKGYEEIEESAYGWPASASYNSQNDTVTITYHPISGQNYTVVDNDFGKVVANVTSVGTQINYTLTVSDYVVVNTDGDNKEIQMIMLDFGTEKHYIKSVVDSNNDGNSDSFVWKTDGERYNQDLYFEIEIVSIN